MMEEGRKSQDEHNLITIKLTSLLWNGASDPIPRLPQENRERREKLRGRWESEPVTLRPSGGSIRTWLVMILIIRRWTRRIGFVSIVIIDFFLQIFIIRAFNVKTTIRNRVLHLLNSNSQFLLPWINQVHHKHQIQIREKNIYNVNPFPLPIMKNKKNIY